jgi:shikimate kinase
VGKKLARRMGLSFVDSDHIIEQRLGCTIREYFEREGEHAFRDMEQATLDELTQRRGLVLSTGGGSALREANRQMLRSRGWVVYLKSSPATIYRRLKHDQTRPLLQVDDPLKKLKDLYRQRDPLYREVAHHVLETGRPPVSALVSMIAMQLEQQDLNT